MVTAVIVVSVCVAALTIGICIAAHNLYVYLSSRFALKTVMKFNNGARC